MPTNVSQPMSGITPAPSCPILRAVWRVLQAVCVADILLGCLIIFIPRYLFELFKEPLPADLLWFQLIGLMLIPMAVDGFIGFSDARRYHSNVIVSCAGRFAASGFLLIVCSVRVIPWILIVLAIGEGLVGALTVVYYFKVLAGNRRGIGS